MRDYRKLCFIIFFLGVIVSRHATNGSTSLVATSSQVPSSSVSLVASSAITTSLMSSMSSSKMTTSSMVIPSSSMMMSSISMQMSSSVISFSTALLSSSMPMSSTMSSLSTSTPSSSSMTTGQTTSTSMTTSDTMPTSQSQISSTTSAGPSSRIMPTSSSAVMTSTVTMTPAPRPEPTEPNEGGTPEESEFGRSGLVLFGVMFAISVILLTALILVIYRNRRQSGTYLTGEAQGSKRINNDGHLSFQVNNGGFDNLETVDLDNDERQISGGAGVTSFSNIDEIDTKASTIGTPKKEIKAVEPPILKFADAGSTNNLLTDNESEKHLLESDENKDLAAMIGIKMEPSSGDSVESLQQIKETDKLMSEKDGRDKDSDEESESSDIDDDLPPPELSGSEPEDEQTNV